jgi:hypothetical protein
MLAISFAELDSGDVAAMRRASSRVSYNPGSDCLRTAKKY